MLTLLRLQVQEGVCVDILLHNVYFPDFGSQNPFLILNGLKSLCNNRRTWKRPFFWPFLCSQAFIDSVAWDAVRLCRFAKNDVSGLCLAPQTCDLSLQVVQSFAFWLKHEYFRLLGDNPIRVIVHDINYHFSFNLACKPQGTFSQLSMD